MGNLGDLPRANGAHENRPRNDARYPYLDSVRLQEIIPSKSWGVNSGEKFERSCLELGSTKQAAKRFVRGRNGVIDLELAG